MSYMVRSRTIEEYKDALQRFVDVVSGKRRPGAQALMTIPVDTETDADVILMNCIEEVERLRKVESRYQESLWETKDGKC